MSNELKLLKIQFKVDYPFHAIHATLHHVIYEIIHQANEDLVIKREDLTTGSVRYTIEYQSIPVVIALHALDTRLCVLQIGAPDDGTIIESQLKQIIETIRQYHEKLITELDQASPLFPSKPAGGRKTPLEDTWAIEQLRAGINRDQVRTEWLRRLQRNRTRKPPKDLATRFRKLVMIATKE